MINNNRDYTVIALIQTIVIVYYMSIYNSLYIVQCSQSHILVSTSILYSLSHNCMSHLVVKIYEFISFKPVCINDILAVIILSFSNLFSLQIHYS